MGEVARGRPSLYTPEVAETICKRLSGGETLRAICRDEGMPASNVVRGWVVDDRQGFYAQYTRAREAGMDAMADELIEIGDDGRNDWMDRQRGDGTTERAVDYEHINRSRLRSDNRKWLMSKIAPKRYGERLQHTGDPENPLRLQVVTGVPRSLDAPDAIESDAD